ncbi:unnamed protein product [Rotaria magnacalcarata]|uniref:Uncharacterized protein n=1 Tax=Rotaria magnacalcarata TaxID=392030 RepID=A0A821DA66_9BILA|nr:unnamed protein product [Rotaria magnacalcarata]
MGKTISLSLSHIISFTVASVPLTIVPSKSILRRQITRAPIQSGNCSNIDPQSFSSLDGSNTILQFLLLDLIGLKNDIRAIPIFLKCLL